MTEPVAIVTGASSGIGLEVADALGRRGFRVVPVGRDPARLQAAVDQLARSGAALGEAGVGDLSSTREVRRLGESLRLAYPRVNLLVNNAGAVFARRAVTEEGHERTWALNVLAPFLLTRTLLPSLRAAGPSSRVVNVASEAHRGARLDWNDLESLRAYRGFRAYSRSKLALILVTQEFARQAPAGGPEHFAVHPGFVATRFGRANGGAFALGIRLAMVFAISAPRGARSVVYAATAPELERRSGAYIAHERVMGVGRGAQDPAAGARLWAALDGMFPSS